MKTIDELWYGNISSFEQCTRADKRLKELLKLVARNREELDDTLTEKQKETLEKFEDCMNEMHSITERVLSEGYNAEQREITERLPALEKEIEHLKESANNVEHFIALAEKFINIESLTPEIIRTFISKIVIHEKSAKYCKSATQQIDIYFTHIGMLQTV